MKRNIDNERINFPFYPERTINLDSPLVDQHINHIRAILDPHQQKSPILWSARREIMLMYKRLQVRDELLKKNNIEIPVP